VKEQYRKSLTAAMRALEDSPTFYHFPREHRKMLRANNPLERLTKEIRRRTEKAEQLRRGERPASGYRPPEKSPREPG
jgi:transposase-like protein